jgi:hypothetical protein
MATILDLRDPSLPLPNFLLLDASVLLAALSPSGAPTPPQRSAATGLFLRRVQQACHNGDTIPLVCILTLEECYFKIIQWGYENDRSLGAQRATIAAQLGVHPNRIGFHQLYKHYPQAIQNYLPTIQAFYQSVIGIPLTILEPQDFVDPSAASPSIEERMRHYIRSCSILPKDAYLTAVANRLGVQHIATLDKDFDRLGADFTVYTWP